MNKERQRKLDARKRRQESLAALGTSVKAPTPNVVKNNVIDRVPKAVDVQHENKHAEKKSIVHEEKRGRGRPRKINADLVGSKKKTLKDERKNK